MWKSNCNIQNFWWLYVITSELDSWPHTKSKISYQHGSDFQLLQSYETFHCESIMASGHENICKLVVDMVLFTSKNAKMLHCVYEKSLQQPPLAWIHSLACFHMPTEMGRCLILLVVHMWCVCVCVVRNVF